jgi:PAS domain S-box-containing protein
MAGRGGRESAGDATAAPKGADGFDISQVLAIADALPMGLAYIDRDRRYRFVNRTLAEFFERPRKTLIGETMDEILGTKAMEPRLPMVEAALAGQRRWFSADFPHPTRGTLAIQTDYLPQTAPDGSVRGVIIITHDVTEQRIAEVALKESEERFRRIADSAPALIWVGRLDGTFDFINQTYADFFGIAATGPISFDWDRLTHPDDLADVRAKVATGLAGGETFALDARFLRHDGEWRWLNVVSRPRLGPDGATIGFVGTSTDVTVAKQAEVELRHQVEARTRELAQSEARVRGLFDSALEMIALLDLDGRYIEVNRSALESLGLDADDVRGMHPWEIGPFAEHPDSQHALRDLVRRAASGETATGELSVDTVRGTASLLVSMKPVPDARGKPMFLVGEGRDISELKQTQDQLRQAQKMEALGQLTGGIAHDFNNLLTVVVGGLDLIAKQVEDERLKRYAGNALKAAERGARLTAQLLAFSRVQRLEVQPMDVRVHLEEIRPLLRNVLGPGIEKKFVLSDEPLAVLADPTQLEVAVLNLVINARDAMPDGGTLTIATARRDIVDDTELEDGAYVELSIADTGCGMPPDVLARVFEPFYTTKEVGKGTGLGLSMVYGMARQSGGTARVESEVGHGTIVSLFFRQADEDVFDLSDRMGAGDAERSRETHSILIVDDDEDVRRFVACSLEEFGHDVVEAKDGPSAIAAFDKARPDLVILDYVMPGMTGAEVARELRLRVPDQPLLFVTGYSESEAIRVAAPDASVIAKPFRPETLDLAVRDAMASRKEMQG